MKVSSFAKSVCAWLVAGCLSVPNACAQGATIQDTTLAPFPRLGVAVDLSSRIVCVDAGSAGDRSGLKTGDQIISVDGKTLAGLNRFQRSQLLQGASGTVAHLVLLRDGKNYSLSVTRKLSSELSMQDSQKYLRTASQFDREFVKIEQRQPRTDQALAQIYMGLSMLPQSLKTEFKAAGIYIFLTNHVSAVDDKEGGAYFSPRDKRAVIHQPNPKEYARCHVTTLHELGHAYDFMHQYPSRQDSFLQIYEPEAASCPVGVRERLQYFLQPGRLGARECFASLFAAKYCTARDVRLELLKETFPKTFQYIRQLP